MSWDINKDREAIQNAINRVARRAQYYARKGSNSPTENDFTYSKTSFVTPGNKPVKLEVLEEIYTKKQLEEKLEFLEEISQRGYIGSIRQNFKDNIIKMAEKMGADKKEIAQLRNTSALNMTKQYKMGTLKAYNTYKRRKASAMVAKLEK